MSKNFLSMNTELQKGDFLLSNNREYKAILQEDGNFVVYGWKPMWHTNTAGNTEGVRLVMQGDCNLVMYANRKPIWQANTANKSPLMGRLTLTNGGFLVVENDAVEMWKSTKNL
ncbi:B-type lectin plumieribetin-like [Trichomycterus rosablanca]|uniref:B-type lectin plumieribetin-like n=1 Tax=Trichomycterus rosablanca TaxID=2290929 RepID=UPI002F352D63